MKPHENLDPLVIAGKSYSSRLLVGTGKYKDFAETRAAVEASGAQIVTVAIRRTNIGQNPNEPSLLDALDPKLANHIQSLRREAADKRVALAAADAEIAALAEWKNQRLHRDVELLAAGHKLIDPREIWHVAALPDLLDEHGDIDEAAVAALIEAKVPAHWRVQVKFPGRGGFHSGSTGLAGGRPSSWAQALARPQE